MSLLRNDLGPETRLIDPSTLKSVCRAICTQSWSIAAQLLDRVPAERAFDAVLPNQDRERLLRRWREPLSVYLSALAMMPAPPPGWTLYWPLEDLEFEDQPLGITWTEELAFRLFGGELDLDLTDMVERLWRAQRALRFELEAKEAARLSHHGGRVAT